MKGVLKPDSLLNNSVCKSGELMCFDDETLNTIMSHAEKNSDKEMVKKINDLIRKPDNKTQLEILYDNKTLDALGEQKYLEVFTSDFKGHSPQGNKLYSNFHINTILQQLHELEPTFRNVDCNLMDFYKDPNSELYQFLHSDLLINEIKSGKTLTFGTIPNTLTNDGNLSTVGHWVGLFGDFRDNTWSIEYYNSSGRNAKNEVFLWMENLAEKITQNCGTKCIALNVTNIESQKGDTECGIYSLHFIISRLMGIPYKEFRKRKINDEDVNKLRKLFLDEKMATGEIRAILKRNMVI